MSDNGKPAMPRRKTEKLTGISDETARRLAVRSDLFRKMTQRKGLPTTWGARPKGKS